LFRDIVKVSKKRAFRFRMTSNVWKCCGQHSGGYMKSVKFWRIEVKTLSLTEKTFFRDAIKTLMAWQVLKEEYMELDLIMRILESEIRIIPENTTGQMNIASDKLHATLKAPGQSLSQ
jgi:hypothetical protein